MIGVNSFGGLAFSTYLFGLIRSSTAVQLAGIFFTISVTARRKRLGSHFKAS